MLLWFVHSVLLFAPLQQCHRCRKDLPRLQISIFQTEYLFFKLNHQMCSDCNLSPNCDCTLPITVTYVVYFYSMQRNFLTKKASDSKQIIHGYSQLADFRYYCVTYSMISRILRNLSQVALYFATLNVGNISHHIFDMNAL